MSDRLKAVFIAIAVAIPGLLASTSVASADPYISLGDSTSTSSMYPGLLYNGFTGHPGFTESLGADEHVALAQGGQTLAGLKNEQLPQALAAINDSDDTKAVTLAIGGNDILGNTETCFGQASGCAAWQASYEDTIGKIRSALDSDPGEEFFGLLSYYNPYRWDGSGVSNEDIQAVDVKLFGTNLTADQCEVEVSTGLNDIVWQAASKYSAVVADPYQAFLDANGGFLADAVHANQAGNEAIANEFLDPVMPADCDPPTEPTCETDPSLCPIEDKVAPRTRIVGMKRSGKRRVTFRFRSSEPGSFRCSIDGRPFRRCGSPKTYRKLKRGRHVFRVRAVDRAGNRDLTPARRVFRIKR